MKRIEIIRVPTNPSAADIIDGFARAYDHLDRPHYVTFRVEVDGRTAVEVQINNLTYKSGRAGMFLFGGNMHYVKEQEVHTTTVTGYYNAAEKDGHLDIPDSTF